MESDNSVSSSPRSTGNPSQPARERAVEEKAGRKRPAARKVGSSLGVPCRRGRSSPVRMPAPGRAPHDPKTRMLPAIMLKPTAVTARAPHGQRAAPHRGADLAAHVAADQDRAVGHPPLAAGIGRADPIPGIAGDLDQAPVHLAAGKIAGIALDPDPAAGHLAADMAARIAVDVDFPLFIP